MGARATSSDVARLARVSRATVSFVLNDVKDQTIPEATRRRVLDAAKELQYVPSAAGRTLRKGKSDLIVFLVPELVPSEGLDQAFAAWSGSLAEHGYVAVAVRVADRRSLLEGLWKSVTPAVVVTLFALTDGQRALIDAIGAPVVEALYFPSGDRPVTSTAQYEVGREQGRHLVARGHRTIAYIDTGDARDRGLAQARRTGLEEIVEHIEGARVLHASWDIRPAAGPAPLAALLVREPRLTALACFNDLVAAAAVFAARTAGVLVPDQLAVVGADNTAFGSFMDPALSSVDLSSPAEADWLVEEVLSAAAGRPRGGQHADVDVTIVARASS